MFAAGSTGLLPKALLIRLGNWSGVPHSIALCAFERGQDTAGGFPECLWFPRLEWQTPLLKVHANHVSLTRGIRSKTAPRPLAVS